MISIGVCPICGIANEVRVGEVDDRALLICRKCRHVYWYDKINADELRAYYELQYSAAHQQDQIQEANRAYYRSHLAELALMLAGRGGAPRRQLGCIVDFGCSYPTLLDEARAWGVARVVGVDFGAEARQAGAQLGIEMWDPQEFADGFEGEADVIRFSHVIEHLLDPTGDLASIAARLAPGGIAYVTQPIFPVLRCEPASLPFQDAVFPEHLHFFNPISLATLMTSAGLQIEEFLAFQAEEMVQALYESSVDLAYAEAQLPTDLGATVPNGFSPLGARPRFYGQNCRAIGRKGSR
jgi:SAM-dependent methyltransferase